MVDIDLLVKILRNNGHQVTDVVPVPENAGDFELNVDGELLTLQEARDLLEQDAAK